MGIYIHLVVFVSFICLIMNTPSFLLNLLDVNLWDIVLITRVLFAIILLLGNFVFLLIYFLENQYFILTCHQSSPDIVILLSFDESSSSLDRVKLGHVKCSCQYTVDDQVNGSRPANVHTPRR